MLLIVTFAHVPNRYGLFEGITLYRKQTTTIMNKVLAITIIATIFTANIASAKQAPKTEVKTKATTTTTTKTTTTSKKMKDTDDQLMSKKDSNSTADYFSSKAC